MHILNYIAQCLCLLWYENVQNCHPLKFIFQEGAIIIATLVSFVHWIWWRSSFLSCPKSLVDVSSLGDWGESNLRGPTERGSPFADSKAVPWWSVSSLRD